MSDSPYAPDKLIEAMRRGGPLLGKEQVERLSRLAGHAINANNGRCALIEEVLCCVTTLCVELLSELDEREYAAFTKPD